MNKKLGYLTIAAFIALPFGQAFAQETQEAETVEETTATEMMQDVTAQTVVATVNGTDITLGEVIIAKAQLPEQYQQLPSEVLFSGLVDQLVQQQLLSDSLTDVPSRVSIALKNEERSLRAGEIVDEVYSSAVTDENLTQAYDAYVAGLEAEQEYNASHILVETQEEAQEIKALIDEGADFAETAKERSTGPSGPNGGELGWFGPGMMVAPFEEAVMGMEPGDVSDPVQTQFGWHIVKLNDARDKPAPTLDELRPQLAAQIQQEALQAHIDGLMADADVTMPEDGAFDPSVVNNLDLLAE